MRVLLYEDPSGPGASGLRRGSRIDETQNTQHLKAREETPGFFVLMPMFPAFLHLRSRRVVVVGGGPVAASKLEALLAAGADVTVVAPEVRPEIVQAGVTVV